MKKIFVIILTMMLIASMAITSHAATPKLDLNLPEIPNISGSVKVEVSDNFWDSWFKANPIKIDFSKLNLWGKN